MVHGPWSKGHGSWTMAHDPWTMDHGPCSRDHGPWTIVHGPWALGRGSWLMVHAPWSMDHGSWTLCEVFHCKAQNARQFFGVWFGALQWRRRCSELGGFKRGFAPLERLNTYRGISVCRNPTGSASGRVSCRMTRLEESRLLMFLWPWPRSVDRGPWTMVHGPWSMDHGERAMDHGPWSMVH